MLIKQEEAYGISACLVGSEMCIRARFVLQPLGEAVTVPLPGAHQVSNALMACAAVRALGVNLPQVLPRLAALKPVPGRMHIQVAGAGAAVERSLRHI